MTYQHPSKQTIKGVLENSKTIAVVGLSDKPDRTSHQIAKIMQQVGYRIIPVNPTVEEVLGEKAYPSLEDIKEPFDIINVFRRSEHLPDIAEQAIKTDAKVFWAQQGIVHDEANDLLKNHDFTVIMDTCIKVAHSVMIGK